MVQHHPTLEQITDYCSGAMPLSHGLCVSTHLEYCDSCRQHVQRLNLMGGVLFDALQSSTAASVANSASLHESDGELKQRVLNLLDDKSVDASPIGGSGEAHSCRHSDTVVPRSLQQFMASGYGDLRWSKITLSIKMATLLRDRDGAQIALSRTSPGGKMFHHSHTGDEITVVLKGSFSDEDGIYKEGDFVFRDAKDKHTPIVSKDAECICLMVMGSPIQFTGFFTRLLNPLVRMNH